MVEPYGERFVGMLTESMEDYLEMIYRLVEAKGYVRAVDLAESLKVQASSATRMVQKLHEAGFVRYEKYRNIALTSMGREYGKFLVWRDMALKQFLNLLNTQAGLDQQVEGIEHYITPKTMGLIRSLIDYFARNPAALREFHAFQQHKAYLDDEDLGELMAWEFRHSTGDP